MQLFESTHQFAQVRSCLAYTAICFVCGGQSRCTMSINSFRTFLVKFSFFFFLVDVGNPIVFDPTGLIPEAHARTSNTCASFSYYISIEIFIIEEKSN